MEDFFISYNKADRAWAEWTAWQLEEVGYTTKLQAWDFRPGSNFVLEMQQAATETQRTIAILSPDYLASLYPHPEWAAAFARDPTGEKRTLVPARVRECELKGMLSQIAYIDLLGKDEATAQDALLEGVKQGRAKPQVAPPFPGTQPRSVQQKPRFPGTLPPIWNVPHNRNPNFTGRKEQLTDLRRMLTSGRPAAVTQAIIGLGGVGKTQLAVEYTYRYSAEYSIVWWVRAEEPEKLAADYAALAAKLNLAEKDERDQRIIIEAVKTWLGRNTGWLIIFDYAQELGDVRLYLPNGTTGHVIITSRNTNWEGVAELMSVKPMHRTEAVEFLLKRTRQEDTQAAAALAEALGDLPLALELAAAHIQETGGELSHYLQLFEARQRELLSRGEHSAEYARIMAAWNISFQQVQEKSPAGADLINLCAFLGPDDIPLELVSGGVGNLPKRLGAVVADPLALEEALAALRLYGFIDVRDRSLFANRLVQAVTRDRLSADAKRVWAEAAVRLVNDAFPFDSDEVQTWPVCSRLLSHALAAASHAEGLKIALQTAARLLNQVGLYLKGRAQFSRAKAVYERALAIVEAAYGPNDPEVATYVNNLGLVLQDLGDLSGARKHYERALAIDEAVYGPNHPNIAIRVNNLGGVLQDLGDLPGARKHYERALAIAEAAYGPNHPRVASIVNNLGRVLHYLGDLPAARKHYERALAIDEAAYGPNHPQVAIRVNNLGSVLQGLGDLPAARKHYERALAIDEAAYGPNHPEVATDLNNLGRVLHHLSDLPAARKCFERALRIFQQFLGDDHHYTKSAAANLQRIGGGTK